MLSRAVLWASRRNATTMSTKLNPPAAPLMVVLGSTGTGKSELAIELAKRFRGEVLNADAMQLYNGLPVITNKVTLAEQCGIPHHLLGHISLDENTWDVEKYRLEATKVIGEIRSRGNLPILVGGTQYYVDPLLFKDVILDDLQIDASLSFPILAEPTEVILDELRKVDPTMADRWHPNDRRKIQRSLEIYLQTGQPASELYAAQVKRKSEAEEQSSREPWETLMFWVYSDREVLCNRLDKRVDKMLEAGLLDEVAELLEFKKDKAQNGQMLDMTKGIWQSIGYKQLEPYLKAQEEGKSVEELEQLKSSGLEDMKTATRRYANYQTRWIRLKQIPRLIEQSSQALEHLYLLDSTDVSKYQERVVRPAVDLASKFLKGEPRLPATELSETAREVLSKAVEPPPKEIPSRKICEVCQTVCTTDQAWNRHVRSAGHKRVIKKKKRLALVPVEVTPQEMGVKTYVDGDSVTPGVLPIFDI